MRSVLAIFAVLALVFTSVAAKPKDVKADSVCNVCLFVANLAAEYIQNNATEQQLFQVLEKACTIFPAWQQQCVDLIQQQGPALIQLLLENVPPQKVCTSLKLCSSATGSCKKAVIPEFAPKAGGTFCSICELIAGALESWLAQNSTIQEVITGLDNICNALPGSLNAICQQTVQTYTPQLIQWILNNEPPQVACTQVGLCTSSVPVKTIVAPKKQMQITNKGKQDKLAGGQLCGICELAMASIETYLANNQTEAQIIAYLENFCNALPGTYGALCDQFVEQYVPLAINWLVQNQPPQVFCTTIGLCTSNTVKMTPLRRANAKGITKVGQF